MKAEMRPVYVVGNWKMNQSLSGIATFFETLGNRFREEREKKNRVQVWIAPQSVHLKTCTPLARGVGVTLGAQNCSTHIQGAYTGEVSSQALAEMGASFTLVGHSERRTLFQEDHDILNRKVKVALDQGLTVIFCLGETVQQKNNGQTLDTLCEQVAGGLKGVAPLLSSPNQLILAYEPVWAIGTGQSATPEVANQVQGSIREILPEVGLQGEHHSIVYGGSVKASNGEALISQPHIDGFLVGGASLDPMEFFLLIKGIEGLCE